MYSAHYHLLLNHWPILGTIIALGLFLVAIFANQESLKQISLVLIVFLALMSIPAYMSGNAAQQALKDAPDLSMTMVENHQGAAFISLLFMELTGGLALLGLWRYSIPRKKGYPGARLSVGVTGIVLLFLVTTVAMMGITGNTGGNIRHPEIVTEPGAISALGTLGGKIVPMVQDFVINYSMWIWPILEDLHFIGLILLVGALGLLNIRILGFLKPLPVAALHRFVPWAIVGFAINIVTGILFFIGMPNFYTNNPDFQWKMAFMVAAGTDLLLFYCTSAFRSVADVGPGDEAPFTAKLVAASSLFLWFSLIVLGRYMPFFEVLQ